MDVEQTIHGVDRLWGGVAVVCELPSPSSSNPSNAHLGFFATIQASVEPDEHRGHLHVVASDKENGLIFILQVVENFTGPFLIATLQQNRHTVLPVYDHHT